MAFRPLITVNQARSSKFNDQHQRVLNCLRELEQNSGNANRNEVLYSHQVNAVLRLHKYFNSDIAIRFTVNPRDSKVALIVLPTGCGKTGVAVLASYVLNASRVLVITPSSIISEQVDDAYKKFLVKRGIIGQDDQLLFAPHKLLVTNSRQLLDKLAVQLADLVITNAHKVSDNDNPRAKVKLEDISALANWFDLIIVDEAHHYPARTWKQFVDHFPNTNKIFLTATPEHRGEPILEEPPCYQLSHDDAVRNGVIRKVEFDEIRGGNSEEEKLKVMLQLTNNHNISNAKFKRVP